MILAEHPAIAHRPRSYVRVAGPDAPDYLQRMVSNDVEALAVGQSCEALLLTPKARVMAPLVVWRRGDDDFLLLTEPELGDIVRSHLLRTRFAAKVELELEEHVSHVVFDRVDGVAVADYDRPAVEVLDAGLEPTISEEVLEVMRIRAGTPRWGREIDDRVLPAEAGLDERAVSFTKGCYPGQEPIARLRFRGHVNRGLRVLAIEGDELPEYDAELVHEDKVVGRITSAARDDGRILALGYVRREVPADAVLRVGSLLACSLDSVSGRP